MTAEGTQEVVTKPDPMVLGVALPLELTMSAAKQVGTAWSAAATAMMTALKGKLAKEAKDMKAAA
jgi:hypothetical protein